MAMAMACSTSALAASFSSSAVASASSNNCISSITQQRRSAVSSGARASRHQGMVVDSVRQDDEMMRREEKKKVSRREIFSLASLSVLLVSADKAQAKDIPLFGIRKQLEAAGKAVETEVKELTKKGEEELEAVTSSFGDVNVPSLPSVSGISPIWQAGGVVGAEVVAVLVAASVVNGLVSVPSK